MIFSGFETGLESLDLRGVYNMITLVRSFVFSLSCDVLKRLFSVWNHLFPVGGAIQLNNDDLCMSHPHQPWFFVVWRWCYLCFRWWATRSISLFICYFTNTVMVHVWTLNGYGEPGLGNRDQVRKTCMSQVNVGNNKWWPEVKTGMNSMNRIAADRVGLRSPKTVRSTARNSKRADRGSLIFRVLLSLSLPCVG